MATNEALKKLLFESYNGMSRPAMFWNIPIMPMVGLMLSGLATGIAGAVVINWVWGLVFLFPHIVILLTLRFMCTIDGQYLRRVLFGWRRLKLNLKYGKPLLLTPFNPRWSAFYGKRFSQQSHAAGGKNSSDEISN